MSKKIQQAGLQPKQLYDAFINNDVRYFCGVPDSLLSPFGFYLEENAKTSHDIAANEGNAVGLAIGYHLATSKVPVVYMQNSGLGNAINPLVSLADPLILGIPMILLIGWRGHPGKIDEPQHQKQGQISQELIRVLGIPQVILSKKPIEAAKQVKLALNETLQTKRPVAILVENDTLQPNNRLNIPTVNYPLSREDAIGSIINSLVNTDILVATTGKAGRELFEIRQKAQTGHSQDLLVVGGMGHASSIALTIAQQKPKRKIFCIDGDGAVIMHMGSMAIIGNKKLDNFYHIVINNGAHESVGGQPTAGFSISLPEIAKAVGYRHTYSVYERDSLKVLLQQSRKLNGPILIEVRVNAKSRKNLSRPTDTPAQNKKNFMTFIG